MDEIIVRAQRSQAGAQWQLMMELKFGDMYNRVCTNYTDGGWCNAYENQIDVANWPVAGGCQSVSGSTLPLSAGDAQALNLEHQQAEALIDGGLALGAALGAAVATSGQLVVVQLLAGGTVGLGTIVATYPDAGDFPFSAGDVVTYEIEACNDGAGGMDVTGSVTIG